MTRQRKMIGFLGVAIVNFIAMLIMCGVGVYGYAAASDYGNTDALSIIITLETIARCVTIPLSGMLGERIGRKKLYCFSVGTYALAYSIVALSSNLWGFAVARAVSGFAWGLFVTNSLVMMTDLFSHEEAPVYSGYLQTISTVAMAVGAPVAGLFCSLDWRVEFYVFIPVIVFGLFMSLIGIPKDTNNSRENQRKSRNIFKTVRMGELLRYPQFVLMLMFTFLFNIGNAAGNYLAAFVQSQFLLKSFGGSLVTMPGIIIAILITPIIAMRMSKNRLYKKAVLAWGLFSALGFGIWWLCIPDNMTWQMCYVILLVGYMVVGIATGISQICPYTYPMHTLPTEIISTGVSLVGFFGAFGAVIANVICGGINNSSAGQIGVLRMPLIPSVIMLALGVFYKDRHERTSKY